ncbi:MAG: hypothetical protein R6U94_04160 [Nitriliruptoraceae bacterium]
MALHRSTPSMTAAVVAVVLTGCGGTVAPGADQLDVGMMEEYGCGYGFWLGSPDERVAVRLAAAPEIAAAGALSRVTDLPDDAWDATVLIGEDLYANWCDDVVEPGEPEPDVAEQWPMTAGTITLQSVPSADCPTEVRGSVSGLEATRPDGTVVDLGERDVGNDTWGCFAG